MNAKPALLIVVILLFTGSGWWFSRNRGEEILTPPSSQPALVSSPLTPPDGFKKLMEKNKDIKVREGSLGGLEVSFYQSGEVSLSKETPGVESAEGFILSFEPLVREGPRMIISSDGGSMTFMFDAESTFFFPEGTNLEAGGKLRVFYKEKNEKPYVILAVGLKK